VAVGGLSMNAHFSEAHVHARRVARCSTRFHKRKHILLTLDALRAGLLVNAGKGVATPGGVSTVRSSTPGAFSVDGGERPHG